MNIDHARYFLVLSQTQHILKASKILGISSTAISHGILKLEDELGVELTQKVGRNIVITDKGIEFARKIEKVLSEISQIKDHLKGDVISQGLYKIGITHNFFPLLFEKKFKQYIENTEGISCEILSLRSADVIASVLKGLSDIGICLSPQDHPDLVKKNLYRGQLLFVANEKHPVFKEKSLSQRIATLNQCFAVGAKAFQGIENCEKHPIFNKLKIKPNYRYVVDSYETKLAILAHSEVWALVPDLIVKQQPKLKVIELGAYHAPYRIEAIWHKARKPLLLYQNLLTSIEEHLQK